jgi:hypothetical protein
MTLSKDDVRRWATATSSNGERTVVFRFIETLGAGARREHQPARIFVVWHFDSETGMPSVSEREQMDQLEDLLFPHLEQDAFATLAIVSTGDGLREWTYYAESGGGFMERLNLALSDLPPFPVEIHEGMDPSWEYYTNFIEGLEGNATDLEAQ